MITISIEGNVGAGKSTLLNKLKEAYPEFNYVPEPVDTWLKVTDKENNNILKLYYSDFKRWAYTFQNFAFITRNLIMDEAIKNKKESNIFVTERCIHTDKNIFAKMLFDDKLMTDLEYSIYNFWFDKYANETKIDAYIYLTTDVDLSADRIKIRNREGENIEKSYLSRLDEYHTSWMDNIDPDKVLRFDTVNDDISKVFDFINNLKLENKIKKLCMESKYVKDKMDKLETNLSKKID